MTGPAPTVPAASAACSAGASGSSAPGNGRGWSGLAGCGAVVAADRTGATCSMRTGTRFCGPCSTARTLPSAARIRLSTPSTGSGRPVGSASKLSAVLLAASPVPSTSGTARVATSSPAAVSSASSRASPGSRSRLLSRLLLTELVLPAGRTTRMRLAAAATRRNHHNTDTAVRLRRERSGFPVAARPTRGRGTWLRLRPTIGTGPLSDSSRCGAPQLSRACGR